MAEPGQPLLVVMALEVESQGLFQALGVEVLYTGLGKVNAAHALGRRLGALSERGALPGLVVNFGTAGSRRFATGQLVACRHFVQRDMDVTGLGFAPGQTPFESIPPTLEHARIFADLPEGVCGSGDRFETRAELAVPCDVIDMEAYALAKVCTLEGVRFACAKYITDGADHAASSEWEANLPAAARGFLELYQRFVVPR
jgi:adenosylhomocysteine nucleosidase